MKYIKYTYVDVKTKKPVSEQPAKRGPVHPSGITPTFALEGTFKTGIPTFYGIAEDSFEPEEWMTELSEEEFYEAIKEEFKRRARIKRKQVEQSFLTLEDGTVIPTSIEAQNRVGNLVASVNNDPELVSVDFEVAPNSWKVLTRDEAISLGKAVSKHVQKCFSWCSDIQKRIDQVTTLEEVLPLVKEINSFGSGD